MSAGLIALLFAAGSGAWVYGMMSKRTLGSVKVSLAVSAIVGLVVLLVVWTLIDMFAAN